MSVWVDVASWNNEGALPTIWTTSPTFAPTLGTKRYQVNFEVPKFRLEVDEVFDVEAIEVEE